MSITKTLFLISFVFLISEYGRSQSTFTKNEFIQNNIKLLNTQLSREGVTLLNEAQITRLEKVFSKKQSKFEKLINSGSTDKGDLSEAMLELDKQFAPEIEAILAPSQIAVFRKNLKTASIK